MDFEIIMICMLSFPRPHSIYFRRLLSSLSIVRKMYFGGNIPLYFIKLCVPQSSSKLNSDVP